MPRPTLTEIEKLATVEVRTEHNNHFMLTPAAVEALADALTAGEAEEAFEEHARYVPACHRTEVWQAIDIDGTLLHTKGTPRVEPKPAVRLTAEHQAVIRAAFVGWQLTTQQAATDKRLARTTGVNGDFQRAYERMITMLFKDDELADAIVDITTDGSATFETVCGHIRAIAKAHNVEVLLM